MKKRVVSAFAMLCGMVLLFDFAIDSQQTSTSEYSENVHASVTVGSIAASTVDIASLDATVSDSDISITAASIGALTGYTNIGICKVSEGNLNIRESAAEDGKLVGKFPRDAACEVVSTEGDWTYIKSGDVEGYVKSQYLITGDEAWEKAQELAQYVATSNTGGLRIRTEASTDSEIYDTMAEGQEVLLLEDLGDWIKVDVDGEEGYVSADYVDIELSLNTAMTLTEARYGAGVSDVRVALCDYALQFVGNRYVWGGTSLTKGVDCSGFTMQVMAKYGVYLSHSSAAQANEGTKISESELKPGDLIFYGRGGRSIGHVAIYIGGGQIVHASNKRDGIKISNYRYRTPVKFVRFIYD